MKQMLLVLAVAGALLAGCSKKETPAAQAPTFPVYPGSRYLTDLTDLFRKASTVTSTSGSIAPQVLYDTDAPLEQVAAFYAKENGFATIAPTDAPGPNGTKPAAYYRTGDLGADARAIEPITKKLNLNVDVSKAVGTYRGAHISQTATRPRVTLSRPYFDPTKSQVVDRTLIIMVREQ